jgi:nicotinate-nucleotide adenylyltransferase
MIEKRTERIGLFGGTFNPFHIGHLKVARDVLRQFGLSRVYFIPSAQPPHKASDPLVPAMDRYEMVSLGLSGDPAFLPCDVEIKRTGPSYSIDTVAFFKSTLDQSVQLYFILGIDAFLEIGTWKDCRKLFEQISFIIMTRPGKANDTADLIKLAGDYARAYLSDQYRSDERGSALIHPTLQPIYLSKVSPVEIASSQIRRMISHGETAEQWLVPAVADYIREKGLYR